MTTGTELAPGVRASEENIHLQFSRTGGPGGQNVNKVNSKVELWISLDHLIGLSWPARMRLIKLAGRRITQDNQLHLIGSVHRTQEANRAEVFDRLRDLIVQAQYEPKRRRKTKPSRASKQRRIESKKRRGKIKKNRGSNLND